MPTINTSQMLQNLDMMKAAASNNRTNSINTGGAEEGGFSSVIKSAIDSVNQAGKTAGKMTAAVEAGDPTVSVVETMIALQKARIQSQALLQVRNKVLSAYKDIMNMPV